MNAQVQEQFDILAKAMDVREEPFRLMKEFEDEHGFVPAIPQSYDAKFMASYRDYKTAGSWRKQWAVVRTVKATARAIVKKQKRLA